MDNVLKSLVTRFRRLSLIRRGLVTLGVVAASFLLLVLQSPNHEPKTKKSEDQRIINSTVATRSSLEGENPHYDDNKDFSNQKVAVMPTPSASYKSGLIDVGGSTNDPRIAYSAQLDLLTKEFSHSRSSLEEILDHHHGYVAKLRIVGKPSGSVLNATLRVPSSEYRSTLTDLKSIGNVEHEEESADEVTLQYSVFDARLLNAQNEERKLQFQLDNRSPKMIVDYTPVERQLAQLRAEMQRIQAERNAYASPVAFANISFSMEEERSAPAETLAAQLKTAALGGFGEVLGTVSAILLFLISRGPILFLWAIFLYLPARYFWRRRAVWTMGQTESQKTT